MSSDPMITRGRAARMKQATAALYSDQLSLRNRAEALGYMMVMGQVNPDTRNEATVFLDQLEEKMENASYSGVRLRDLENQIDLERVTRRPRINSTRPWTPILLAAATMGMGTIALGRRTTSGSTTGSNAAKRVKLALPNVIAPRVLGRTKLTKPTKRNLSSATNLKFRIPKKARRSSSRAAMMMKPSRSILLRNKRAKRRAALRRKVQKIIRFINTNTV